VWTRGTIAYRTNSLELEVFVRVGVVDVFVTVCCPPATRNSRCSRRQTCCRARGVVSISGRAQCVGKLQLLIGNWNVFGHRTVFVVDGCVMQFIYFLSEKMLLCATDIMNGTPNTSVSCSHSVVAHSTSLMYRISQKVNRYRIINKNRIKARQWDATFSSN